MLGRYILPWFGGGAGVWTACLLFFQLALLAGYAYAHLLTVRLAPSRQAQLHLVLLLASLAFLPVTPGESWRPLEAGAPAPRIVALLTATVGFPFVLLASTGPLLQRWFAWERPGVSPYRFYALSNAGSLLGLLTYPFVVEPLAGLRSQTWLWSLGYGLFVATSATRALQILRRARARPEPARLDAEPLSAAPGAWAGSGRPVLWLLLPACGSLLLLATTQQITQYVAPIPLIWVLPLSLYLVSFILCFDNDRWYDRRFWAPAFLVSLAGMTYLLWLQGGSMALPLQLGGYSFAFFACCMVCHGELARLRPDPRQLTAFYLFVAAGGALGGIVGGLVAPWALDDFWELHFGLLAAYALFVLCVWGDPRRWRGVVTPLFVGVCVLAVALGELARQQRVGTIASSRNFYGVLRVDDERPGTQSWRRLLRHGGIIHGGQLLQAERRYLPRSFFGPESGVALAMNDHPRRGALDSPRVQQGGLHVGAVGLGVGVVAAYGRPRDEIRFYEINPEVVRFAREHFTYLEDSAAHHTIVPGDARISLERELATGGHDFDVLIVDAFNSDTIPVHLITREAFEIYWQHLKPDGVLAVHVTTLYIDVGAVVRGLAEESGRTAVRVIEKGDTSEYISWSEWVLVTTNEAFLSGPRVRSRLKWPADGPLPVWTDDRSDLLRALPRPD